MITKEQFLDEVSDYEGIRKEVVSNYVPGHYDVNDLDSWTSGYWEEDRTFYMIDLASYGQYSNLTEVANYKSLVGDDKDWVINDLDRCKWLIGTTIHGMHVAGWYEDELPERSKFYEVVIDILHSLSDYPVIDEELWSQLEYEAEEEAWDNWAAHDFRRELLQYEWSEEREEEIEEMDNDDLYELFRVMCEAANEYPVHEQQSVWWDMDRIVDQGMRALELWFNGREREQQIEEGQMVLPVNMTDVKVEPGTPWQVARMYE